MESSLFTIKGLRFAYGDHVVFDGLDLTLREGVVTTLIGANGSGKTTLFNLMTKQLRPLAGDVYLLLSVHEETDRLGGTVAGGFSVDPVYAMVIDVNLGRTPDTRKRDTVALGGGISLAHSVVCDRALTRRTAELCERENIAYQYCTAPVSTGTDTGALHLAGKGIPCVDVGLPLRAMHTYVEMIDGADAAALSALCRAFVCDGKTAEVFGR